MVSFGCEKDNFEGPDSTFYGQLIDKKTGEPLQQEISDGSRLYYIEQGWGDNPQIQNMVIKSDGSFRNAMMFSGDYEFILNRGNYVPLDTIAVVLRKGDNHRIFEVTPYLRVIEPEIIKEGRTIVAKFRLEQVASAMAYRISLFVHSHADVSNRLNIVNRTIELNRSLNGIESFQISINLDEYSSTLREGASYYFRIGAQSHAGESRYNYAESVLIKI